jgi:hypothetical protein
VNAARRLLLGDAFVRAGDTRAALRAYGSLEHQSLFLYPFVPRALLRSARTLESTGDREGAIRQYRRFVAMWSQADTELRPVVDSARASLQRLGVRAP